MITQQKGGDPVRVSSLLFCILRNRDSAVFTFLISEMQSANKDISGLDIQNSEHSLCYNKNAGG